MIIDTHCHIDMYENPLEVALECENKGIITIGMTNLPSHFEMGQPHLLGFKKVRLALGMHPLFAEFHEKEFSKFVQNIDKTSYIGEIGLDFSKEGIKTKDIQIETFEKILKEISGKRKVLSLHSRKAEKEVLTLLRTNNIESAIFHWYSGSTALIDEILNAGYYFSINISMINSKLGQQIIRKIPSNRILTESDGPFTYINSKESRPIDISYVIEYISNAKKISIIEAEKQIQSNFGEIIKYIK